MHEGTLLTLSNFVRRNEWESLTGIVQHGAHNECSSPNDRELDGRRFCEASFQYKSSSMCVAVSELIIKLLERPWLTPLRSQAQRSPGLDPLVLHDPWKG